MKLRTFFRTLIFLFLFLFVIQPIIGFGQDLEQIAEAVEDIHTYIDYVWVLACAALVFLMQAGFMALESGLSRAKNSINVSIKNLADFVLAVAGFWLVGFGLMFGTSHNGLFGTTEFFMDIASDPWRATFFVFQAVFVGTAATIDSGAVAERTKFSHYLITSLFISVIIYPIFGHWAWGSFLNGETFGWLEQKGFLDFAGSTVVHSVGAWVALAEVIIIGPRIGKFDENGKARKIPGHNLPLVYLGTFILFFGWFGFNGGSTLRATPEVGGVIMNTILSASFGAIGSTALSWIFGDMRLPEPEMIANGVLGGLVGITAGCAFVEAWGAVLIGLTSGLVVFVGSWFMEHVLKLDDVVGAIPVHGFCGLWGTIATGIFITKAHLATTGLTRLQQIGVQSMGAGVAFVWAFGLGYLFILLINKIKPMRVSREDELKGLNVTEHGATSSLIGLAESMRRASETTIYNESYKVDVEFGTEIGELAVYYNTLIDALIQGHEATENALTKQREALTQVEHSQKEEHHIREELERERTVAADELKKYYHYMEDNVFTIGERIKDMRRVLGETLEISSAMKFSMDNVESTIQSLESSISSISQQTDHASKMASQNAVQVESSIKVVHELGQSVKEIRKIIENINEISAKTKVLAINASIEAARAGTSGRGFVVVANEVKKLADISSESAAEIAGYLQHIQDNAENTVETMDQISVAIKDIRDINGDIASEINHEVQSVETVAQITRNAAVQSNRVVDSIMNVNEGTEKISNKVSESYEELDRMMDKSRLVGNEHVGNGANDPAYPN